MTARKGARGSFWKHDEPLTEERLVQHVNGGPARGVCPIKEGESVTLVAVLDFDSHGGETAWPEMQRAAENVMVDLRSHGYRPIPFRSSGGRGIHLYLLWDEPQDAYSVRAELAHILELGGLKSGAKGVVAREVEIFPKQDEVQAGEFGNQFILPLAGHSEPLDELMGLEPMGKEWVLQMSWPTSKPVPRRERPVRHELALLSNVEPLEKVRSALFSIPNDDELIGPDYDEFRNLVFSVHEATGGSEEGFEVLQEWAEQNPKHHKDPKFLRERIWDYIKDADKRSVAITRGTLYAMAGRSGWFPPTTTDGFDDVADVKRVEVKEPEPLPAFRREKNGRISAVVGNLLLALRREDITGSQIAYDAFRDEIMLAQPGTRDWRPFRDADYVWLRDRLEMGSNGFMPIGKEMLRDVVAAVASEREFDSAQLWLTGLPHDGVSRIDTFLTDYFGVEDNDYHRAVSRYMWTAMAGRVLEPGVKADMVPIFVGHQGAGKSTVIESLVPSPDFFCEVAFSEKDDDLARKMKGKLIAEIGELRGLHTREIEAIKAFITRRHENWVPKFKEFATAYPRRLLFIGSTNAEQFLADETGNRRWLPVGVGKVDVEGVRRVVLELWAEARELFLRGGVAYQEAERLGAGQHQAYKVVDGWSEVVRQWLETPEFEVDGVPTMPVGVTTLQALVGALRFDAARVSRKDEMRMGAVLRELGLVRRRIRTDRGLQWLYVPSSSDEPTLSLLDEAGGNTDLFL